MDPLLTSWGQPDPLGMVYPMDAQGMSPFSPALMQPLGRVPMFAGGGPPRYTGPFNMALGQGTSLGGILQTAAPLMLSQLMQGTGRAPFQFFPEQNIYDQLRATQFYHAQRTAMAMASTRDQQQMNSVMNGFQRFMNGRELNAAELARNERLSGGVASWMPILSQFLGPDLVDQLSGSRGSATIMAQQLHTALRTSVDPVTGRVGPSAASIGAMTENIYDRLYGQGADLSAIHGLRAGQVGSLVNELQGRGLLGSPLGIRNFQERLGALGADYRSLRTEARMFSRRGEPVPVELLERLRSAEGAFMSDDDIARAAERLPEIADARRAGRQVTAAELGNARDFVRQTRRHILTDPEAISPEELARMPGGEDMVRAADASRIASRVRSLSGVVKAMRDIFGDAGHPDAPMRELLNGLDALTQGGLTTMSPNQLETMVRRSHAIASSTGIGLPGMMGLMSQAAGFADRFGVDRGLAVSATQGAALFGAAARDVQGSTPAWGRMNQERLTLADLQLRVAAAASPAVNQLNALLRMRGNGLIAEGGGGAPANELAAIMQAIDAGQDTYSFGGRAGSLRMTHEHLARIVNRDAGVNAGTFQSIVNDRNSNQEFGQLFNTANIGRRLQRADIADVLGSAAGNALIGGIDQRRVGDALRGAGINISARRFVDSVQGGIGADMINMSEADMMSDTNRTSAITRSLRQNIREQIKARMPGAADPAIDNATNAVIQSMGGDEGLRRQALGIFSSANANIQQRFPIYGTVVGAWQASHRGTFREADRRDWEASFTASMQSALSPLGATDAIPRIMDAISQAQPGSTLTDILSQGLGGVNLREIAALSPDGPLAQALGLMDEGQHLDPATEAGRTALTRNASVIRGLTRGGTDAATAIQLLERGSVVAFDPNDAAPADIRAAIERQGRHIRAQGGNPAEFTDDQLLRQAIGAGNLRLSPHSAQLSALYEAHRRGGAGRDIQAMGFTGATNVSTAIIKSTGDAIRDVRTLAGNAAMVTQRGAAQSQNSVAAMIANVRQRTQALLGDPRSLEQLGAGGVDLITAIRADADALDTLAAANSVSVGELLTKPGVPAAAKAEAVRLLDRIKSNWEAIESRRDLGMLPNRGDDPRNQRAAITPEEQTRAAGMHSFLTRFQENAGPGGTVAQQQAGDVVERMAQSATPAQAAAIRANANTLTAAVLAGDRNRAPALDAALRAREELVRIAHSTGFFGSGRRLNQLSGEEMAQGVDYLTGIGMEDFGGLTEAQRARVRTLAPQVAPLAGLGDPALGGNIAGALQNNIGAVPGAIARPQQQAAAGGTQNIRITGEATMRFDNNTMELALNGVNNIAGAIANIVGGA